MSYKSRTIYNDYENKKKCINKYNSDDGDDTDIKTDEPFLFFKVNVIYTNELVTICLSQQDAIDILSQRPNAKDKLPTEKSSVIKGFEYVVNGFTPRQYEEMEYFINKKFTNEREFALVDADVSDAKDPYYLNPPKRKVSMKDEYKTLKNESMKITKDNFYKTEVKHEGGEEYDVSVYGDYYHSPDEKTPGKINVRTGEASFYAHGKPVYKIDKHGRKTYYSQTNGKIIN